MHCCTSSDSPEHLQELVEKTSNNRRSNNNAMVPKFKTRTGRQQAPYQGPQRWNKLPEEIRNQELKKFKKTLKKNYLEKYWTIFANNTLCL